MRLADRLTHVLSYGQRPAETGISPRDAMLYACQLIIEHHDAHDGRALLFRRRSDDR